MVSCGKAAWQMGYAASNVLGDNLHAGVVVTKYDHVMGPIGNFICCEAGHPVPDENSFAGTQKALDLLPQISDILKKWEVCITSELTEDEIEVLSSLLARLKDKAALYMEGR